MSFAQAPAMAVGLAHTAKWILCRDCRGGALVRRNGCPLLLERDAALLVVLGRLRAAVPLGQQSVVEETAQGGVLGHVEVAFHALVGCHDVVDPAGLVAVAPGPTNLDSRDVRHAQQHAPEVDRSDGKPK